MATATTKLRRSTEPLPVRTVIEDKDRTAVAEGLRLVLADSCALLAKTHGYHWNVTGPQFPGLHALFETQYRELHAAIDEIAERVRALGFFAPGGLAQLLELSGLDEEDGVPDAAPMLRRLAQDNEAVARRCRAVMDLCGPAEDTASEDLMNQRIAVHEKAAWMLRASLG